MAARVKRYVSVISRTTEDGAIIPISIIFEDDGRRWEIDKILDKRQAASRKAGGNGIRYVVRINGKETVLYHEKPRWFVELKVPDGYNTPTPRYDDTSYGIGYY